jgi:lantibiotic modifying enzyme
MGSWCNGIPGIGLARLGCLPMLCDSDVQEEVEKALSITESWPNDGVDHLCCGSFGRVEVLLAAAERLSRPRLREVARQIAQEVMGRQQDTGAYRLFGGSFGSPLFNPSFFQGMAGIGYELLRVAYPEALGSVLLWE